MTNKNTLPGRWPFVRLTDAQIAAMPMEDRLAMASREINDAAWLLLASGIGAVVVTVLLAIRQA